jgi:TPR repeat protein
MRGVVMRMFVLFLCSLIYLAPAAYSAGKNPLTFELDAMTGNPEAQYAAGMAYLERNWPRDNSMASDWFAKAAKQGHVEAQYKLGYMFENGMVYPSRNLELEAKAASEWFRKAAEQGHALAALSLAELNRKRHKAEKEDIKWYRLAAEKGYVDAQFRLGVAYAVGDLVLIDYKEAFSWLEKASKQGNASSKCYLAELYVIGKGVKTDLTLARNLAREGYESNEEYCKWVWERYDLANQ